MAVWVPWASVLICGDYLSPVEIPIVEGSIDGYLATLARLEPLVEAAAWVVPGHGEVLEGVRAAAILREDRAYVEGLRADPGRRGASAGPPGGRAAAPPRSERRPAVAPNRGPITPDRGERCPVGTSLVKLGQAGYNRVMRVNVGQAKTNLSKLLAEVERGAEVEIARNGVPVARLVRIDPVTEVGARFLASRGSLAGQISIGEDFEFSEEELDELFEAPG